VWNDVELDGGPDARVVLDRTTLLGDVSGRTGDVLLTGAKVVGTWDVAVDHVTRIRAATWVSAPATVRGGRVLIHDARFSEGLTLDGTGDALVCRTRIGLDLLVTHLTDYARIGLEVPYACGTQVEGSVLLVTNRHSIDLGTLTVGRHLVCVDSTGPRGVTRTAETVVSGSEYGSCG